MTHPTLSPGDDDSTAYDLSALRKQIDSLDEKLINLLNERAQVVVDIGKAKRADGVTPIYAPDRERIVMEQIRRWNKGPLPHVCLEGIWRELMSGSFALEKPLRIGYLGPAGSHSHLAAKRKFGSSVEYDPVDDIHGIFEEVERGHVDLGLVPIENSIVGSIGETHDAFVDAKVKVCAEVVLHVHHNLLSNCPPEAIKKIYSKPVALGQCRNWLNLQLKHAEKIGTTSTSKAAEMASQEEGAAAVGSTLAAELYNLQVTFANIEDNPRTVTRFFVIGDYDVKPTGDDKTAIMFTTEHRAGALTSVLNVLRDHGINMTHIDKRPSKRVNWEYVFFVDVLGHATEPQLAAAMEDARQHCLHLTVLGSFPRAADELS